MFYAVLSVNCELWLPAVMLHMGGCTDLSSDFGKTTLMSNLWHLRGKLGPIGHSVSLILHELRVQMENQFYCIKLSYPNYLLKNVYLGCWVAIRRHSEWRRDYQSSRSARTLPVWAKASNFQVTVYPSIIQTACLRWTVCIVRGKISHLSLKVWKSF